jgi:hypothetical protein
MYSTVELVSLNGGCRFEIHVQAAFPEPEPQLGACSLKGWMANHRESTILPVTRCPIYLLSFCPGRVFEPPPNITSVLSTEVFDPRRPIPCRDRHGDNIVLSHSLLQAQPH